MNDNSGRKQRSIFYLSDHTSLTAESLGHSLVAQFPGIEWNQRTLPYINSEQAAQDALQVIDRQAGLDGNAPLVIDTLIDSRLRRIISRSKACVLDVFGTFLPGLEEELGEKPAVLIGAHNTTEPNYTRRIDAIQFSMEKDDGQQLKDFDQADIVMLGVSRTGKTPTCLYLAIQFGIKAANYPLDEEELSSQRLPEKLQQMQSRLFGLTITPEHLSSIRQQRFPNSDYADPGRCHREIQDLEEIYRRYEIPWLDVTEQSIEEVATQALNLLHIERYATANEASDPA